MHELSIVSGIVRIAEEHAQKMKASGVEKIELEIGELAGIELRALDFVWDIGVRSSVLEHSKKEIIEIPGKARCMDCNHIFHMKVLFDACPACNSYFSEILAGKELRVKVLTLLCEER